MDIKIDRVFQAQVPTGPFYSTKVFKCASLERFKTRKPFDIRALSNYRKKTDHFEIWLQTRKENQSHATTSENHLEELLKTPMPLQNFELTMAYKSNRTTFQSPMPLGVSGKQTGASNRSGLDYLIYERVQDEILNVGTLKNHTLPAQLMAKGRLLMNEEGFFFLKFKESYFQHYLNIVLKLGGQKPSFLEQPQGLGFHMGLIMPEEYKSKKLWGKIKEIGKEFYVGISGCYQVNLKDHIELEKVWILKMESQPLFELREKYGLPRAVNGHGFMVTLGEKKRVNPDRIEEGCYRMNPSIYAV